MITSSLKQDLISKFLKNRFKEMPLNLNVKPSIRLKTSFTLLIRFFGMISFSDHYEHVKKINDSFNKFRGFQRK